MVNCVAANGTSDASTLSELYELRDAEMISDCTIKHTMLEPAELRKLQGDLKTHVKSCDELNSHCLRHSHDCLPLSSLTRTKARCRIMWTNPSASPQRGTSSTTLFHSTTRFNALSSTRPELHLSYKLNKLMQTQLGLAMGTLLTNLSSSSNNSHAPRASCRRVI